jgi:PAS domain S-box-containing protein
VVDAHDYTIQLANSASKLGEIARKPECTCYMITHQRETPCTGADHPCPLEEVKKRKAPVTMEHVHVDKEDRIRHVEVHGYPMFDKEGHVVQMIEYVLDITKRKQAEEALRKSARQYRLLAENVADGIGILQGGKLVFVNEALTNMLGFTAEQLLGKPLFDLAHEDYKADIRHTHEQLEAGESEPQWRILQCIFKGDGRELWIEGRYSIIEWEGQSATLVSMRDISAHKLREFAIEEEKERFRQENIQLKSTLKERYRFGDIIGKSSVMQNLYNLILDAASSDANVIISGESGTGKELVAWTLHSLGLRQYKTFVPVNCGAIQETLFESEFFGHRKGAFTGAHKNKAGFFDLARGGTLFLDEVGELSPAMQVKLLRAIEGGGYIPVGGNAVKTTDIRLIAATNRDLTEQVKQGTMRKDFFYRLHVISITVPPLRERREDIPLLIDHFLNKYSEESAQPKLPGWMLKSLYEYDWPGNVRELENTVQRFLTTNRLDFIDIRPAESGENVEQHELKFHEAIEHLEKQLILRALEQHRWNRTSTAEMLGIPRKTLFRKMKKYGLM